MSTKYEGFTLIELMIAAAIIAIIAAIAYPSYQDSVRKSRRVDAKAALLNAAQVLERRYTEKNQYCNDGSTGCEAISTATENGYYTIAVSILTGGQSFRVTATPVSGKGQTADSACGGTTGTHFEIDQKGVKYISNGTKHSDVAADKAAVAACW